jgi:hypothetical protein
MSEEDSGIVILVPILNFDCDEDIVKLDKTLSIRRVRTGEIETMLEQFPNSKMLKSALGDTKFVIEERCSSEETPSTYFRSKDDKSLVPIVTSLRLLEIGETPMLTSFYVSADSLYISDPYPKRVTTLNNYHILSKEKIEDFKALWKAQKNADKKKPHLLFALSQFNKSFEDSSEEEFIDYITAFESIVFGRGTNPPSPYGRAIGIAIGMLIGKNEKERTSIEQKLNEAYEIRNKVAHGHLRHKLDSVNDEKLLTLLAFTKECLIQTLQKLLKE